MNKNILIYLVIIFCFLSCENKKSQLVIDHDGYHNYEILTNDKRILFSFSYNEDFAPFPFEIRVPNYCLNNPMMINISFNENLEISGYKISDGKYFESIADVVHDENIDEYVFHSLKIKNEEIIYAIKKDGTFDIIERFKIDSIDPEIPKYINDSP